ncbi:hypothetical protein KC19_8G166300 [Ceratodon purpureus]|uniref:Uncharacterized protein n=1 Tax=Ceratodon purpureus TaxID=3225 RepID=A0A8T0H1A7_CERPU|nr:hypothetical protein KC19_8G166300 [Ceratodon purpureus]
MLCLLQSHACHRHSRHPYHIAPTLTISPHINTSASNSLWISLSYSLTHFCSDIHRSSLRTRLEWEF